MEAFLFKSTGNSLLPLWLTLSHSYRIYPKAITCPSANRCNMKIWDALAILIMEGLSSWTSSIYKQIQWGGVLGRTLQFPTVGQKMETTLLKKHAGLWFKGSRNWYSSISSSGEALCYQFCTQKTMQIQIKSKTLHSKSRNRCSDCFLWNSRLGLPMLLTL